ncbi:BQ2448_1368 [Microbotryum intermedium]|uniref:BQ2448_1368 protein n=1 Tax=Microbotryum intermedium TaxID=269621 RepID=A0A238FDL5_9BASI|nr:BQ2448_1368 [Microbotryum intermedium]
MLSRSLRANLNQENPQHAHRPATGMITKTPARPSTSGPGKGMLGAGSVVTARHSNKVLCTKDRNGGVGGGFGVGLGSAVPPSSKGLVFDASSKPGPSVALQTARGLAFSPEAAQARLPDHLRTPSPGVHRCASLSFSPEVVIDPVPEVSDETPVEVDMDQDVELAGASARDHDEAFDPEFFIPNYGESNLGDVMRGIELGMINADYETLASQDEADRRAFRALLETSCDDLEQSAESPSHPIFPMPVQRKALSVKSTNTFASTSTNHSNRLAQVAAPKLSGRPASATVQNLRRPPRKGVDGDGSSPWLDRDTRTSTNAAVSRFASTSRSSRAKFAETSHIRSASAASKGSAGRPASRLVPGKTGARGSPPPSPPPFSSSSNPFPISNNSLSSDHTLFKGRAPAAPTAALDEVEVALEAFGIVEAKLQVFEDEQYLGVDDALSFRFDVDC